MNCVFNGKLDKINLFKNSHISYAPDDSGVSIGAALLAFNQLSKTKFKPKEITSCYFGPEYSNFQIKTILDQSKIKYENKKMFVNTLQKCWQKVN